jgi:muconolactone delta-isomerase
MFANIASLPLFVNMQNEKKDPLGAHPLKGYLYGFDLS